MSTAKTNDATRRDDDALKAGCVSVALEAEGKIKVMIQLDLHTEKLLNRVTEQQIDFFFKNIIINTDRHNGLIIFLFQKTWRKKDGYDMTSSSWRDLHLKGH